MNKDMPAFPSKDIETIATSPVFMVPTGETKIEYAGMTIKQWYVGQALKGLVSYYGATVSPKDISINAIAIANATLDELDKEEHANREPHEKS